MGGIFQRALYFGLNSTIVRRVIVYSETTEQITERDRCKGPAKRTTHFNAKLLPTTCCTRLTTVLQYVGWRWIKFENDQIFLATFFDVAWCCLYLFGHVAPERAH